MSQQRKRNYIALLGFILLLNTATAQSRRTDSNQYERGFARQTQFSYLLFPMPVFTRDSILLKIFIKIPFPSLQFTNKNAEYLAQYDLIVQIQNSKEESVFGKIIKKRITADTYKKTRDPDSTIQEVLETHLLPGAYFVFMELNDSETNRPVRKKENLTLPDFFSKPIGLTAPLFYHQNGFISTFFPEIPAVRSMRDSLFFAKVWITAKNPDQKMTLTWSVLEDKRGENKTKPVFQDSMVVILKNPVQSFDLAIHPKTNFGRYELLIKARDERTTAEVKSPFMVRWGEHPNHFPDFKMRVSTLNIIMGSKEYAELKKMPEDSQKAFVVQFWKQRDPTPGTPENELEEEYNRRVQYVNSNFSTVQEGSDGWQTDRGRIYLLYGSPTEILHDPGYGRESVTKVLEVWYYQNMQKRFVFADATGSGDYRLVSQE